MFRQPLLSVRSRQLAALGRPALRRLRRASTCRGCGRYVDLGRRGARRAAARCAPGPTCDDGQVVGGTADLALARRRRHARRRARSRWRCSRVTGRLGGKRLARRLRVRTPQDLQFDTADGLRWPGGNLCARVDRRRRPQRRRRANCAPTGWTWPRWRRSPAGCRWATATHAALAGLCAAGPGRARRRRSWQGPLEAPAASTQARGRVSGLAARRAGARRRAGAARRPAGPGVRGATRRLRR